MRPLSVRVNLRSCLITFWSSCTLRNVKRWSFWSTRPSWSTRDSRKQLSIGGWLPLSRWLKWAANWESATTVWGTLRARKLALYRDTTGVDAGTFEQVLGQCDRATLAGKRDYALLRLLWGNALRRNEVSLLSVRDFDPVTRTLRILGKGRGTQCRWGLR